MHTLIAAQIAFCFVILFFAELFVATFRHLSSQPLGFDAKDLLLLETATRPPPESWSQMTTPFAPFPE